MPLIINELPKQEPKEIRMGKPEADYYPPGATEPQVKPAAPAVVPVPKPAPAPTPVPEAKGVITGDKEEAHEDVAKTSAKKPEKK